jgi:osmotically-inducible protein OsmY
MYMVNRLRIANSVAAVVLVAGLAASLQGCVGLVVGGAAVGAMAATDRRTVGTQTEDKEIALKANTRLHDVVGDAGHVDVLSYDRKVLLTGEVKDAQMKEAAASEVRKIEGVQDVMDELEIGDVSSYKTRSSDAYITGKVEAAFIGEKQLNSNAIKVTTERGNVYLLGRVTEREGQIAAQVASGVGGVMKVVKMFEYISDDELKKFNAPDGARS